MISSPYVYKANFYILLHQLFLFQTFLRASFQRCFLKGFVYQDELPCSVGYMNYHDLLDMNCLDRLD